MIDKQNKNTYTFYIKTMKIRQSRVFHLQIQSLEKKETERARVTLIDQLHKGCFSRKNTRSLEQIKKDRNEHMLLTGSDFFKQRPISQRRPSTGSISNNPSLACSALFSKGILPTPATTKSCFNFYSDSKPSVRSQTGKAHLYSKIRQQNQKMISQIFLFEDDQGDFVFKRESTPKTHLDLFRYEEMIKREKTKGKKEFGQKTRWENKKKGFNCVVTHKKMKELERKCELQAWEALGETQQVEY